MTEGPTLFLSHAHDDKAIVDTIAKALQELFANRVKVNYSSKAGAINAGERWLNWIHEQVAQCDAAIIVITPTSAYKAWVLWEAGAVEGAARAKFGDLTDHKIKPISLLEEAVSPPPVFSHRQVPRARNAEQLGEFFLHLLRDFRATLPGDVYEHSLTRAHEIARRTRDTLMDALEGSRIDSSDALVREWVERLDTLTKQGKLAQAASVARWAKQAFLAPGSDIDREPIDFRLHRRFGDIYREQKDWRQAKREYELARFFSPRDVMILRELGRVSLELKDIAAAETYVRKIHDIDNQATHKSEEIAAFVARVYKDQGNFEAAAKTLKTYEWHRESYYLVNNIALYTARAHGLRAAEREFDDLLSVLDRTAEKSVWVQATRINALLALGREGPAREALADLKELGPTEGELSAMEKDFDFICDPQNGRWNTRFDWRAAFAGSPATLTVVDNTRPS